MDHYEIGKGRIDFTWYRELLEEYPFTMAMETRDKNDVQGSVLRSRDRLREVLGSAAR